MAFPEIKIKYRKAEKLDCLIESPRLYSDDRSIYLLLRGLSSTFISKKAVREYIFTRDGNACKKCGGKDNLQIDHIISVASCMDGKINPYELNSETNLQTLCRSCNAGKLHD